MLQVRFLSASNFNVFSLTYTGPSLLISGNVKAVLLQYKTNSGNIFLGKMALIINKTYQKFWDSIRRRVPFKAPSFRQDSRSFLPFGLLGPLLSKEF